MAYIDAYHDRRKDTIRVAERINGKRLMRDLKPVYEFYATDARGTIPSVTGKMTTRYTFDSNKAMKEGKKMLASTETFESDVNVLVKTLSKNYKNEQAPDLHTAFFDIETDFCHERGYAPVDDPFNRVTAVSMYLKWIDALIMLVLKPEGMPQAEAEEIVARFADKEGHVVLCTNEVQMLTMFLDMIEDADVLSGWNSEFYDVPYLVNRIEMIMSSADTSRFCLWGQAPRARKTENYGKEITTYDFIGRVHFDYLELYKKHAGQVEQSYALDVIGEKITKQRKVPYDGNLDTLYNQEFEKFIDYGLQDSKLLYLIDKKLDYVNLHNRLAHQECVPLPATMGSVQLLETAVINEIHSWGEVVFDKREHPHSDGAAGAFVQDPVKGLHDAIGLIDLNSLYPSVIRALKMSTESIVGQVRQDYTEAFLAERIEEQRIKSKSKKFEPNYTSAWHPLFAAIEHTKVVEGSDDLLTVDMEDGSTLQMTGKELQQVIFDENSTLVISANGTLFDRSKKGVIPSILERWYTERQLMQRAVMDCKQLAGKSTLEAERGYTTEEMETDLNGYTRRAWLAENEPQMTFTQKDDGKWYSDQPDVISTRAAYWKMMQQIRKILLNSLYGALLNKHCRFYDKRLGQSVTLTGRSVTKHMASQLNVEFGHTYSVTGGVVVYGDTDSVMFSAKKFFEDNGIEFDWNNREAVIELYLAVCDRVDQTFPGFMHKTFNTGLENGKIIAAGLEITGSRGLFLKKKRYGILKYWEDGFRKDVEGKPGELKAMGVEIKRSDTPKFIQNFLEEVFINLLDGGTEEELREKVKAFKRSFKDLDPWKKGSPKAVKNLTNKTAEYERTGKCGVGHVLAAINWNQLRDANHDVDSPEIVDGGKTIVCKLKDNQLGIKTIGYPIECADRLPEWFTSLPFDVDVMEAAVLTKKLDNLFGIVDMDLAIHDNLNTTIDNADLFSW